MLDLNPKADVLIITVAKVESQAVMQVFRETTGQDPKPVRISDRIYHNLGDVNGARVFMALSEMGAGGLGASQQAVQKGIAALRPLAVIMVGIAFGINEKKQSIGDILVSQQLWLYDLQRVGKDQIIPRGDKPHASSWLIDYLRSADLYWQGATVLFGLVLTGEKLVDNVDYREQLKHYGQEAIGGEMEGAGLYVACQDSKVDWVLVKAICDWADGNKSEDKAVRQQLAAHNAAIFVIYALQQAPIIPKSFSETKEPASTKDEQERIAQTDQHRTLLDFGSGNTFNGQVRFGDVIGGNKISVSIANAESQALIMDSLRTSIDALRLSVSRHRALPKSTQIDLDDELRKARQAIDDRDAGRLVEKLQAAHTLLRTLIDTNSAILPLSKQVDVLLQQAMTI